MLNWNDDRDLCCKRIKENAAVLKILLKTKDDNFFLRNWYDYHRSIVGSNGIIIFDNMSKNDEVLKFYSEIDTDCCVIQFDGLHNYLHETAIFDDLYQSLFCSCKYFCFIDTDEFLTLYKEERLFDGPEINSFLLSTNEPILPSLWLENLPGQKEYFLASESALLSGRRWGKPVIKADINVEGLICHNTQVSQNYYSHRIDIVFILKHYSRLHTSQRIGVNISKLEKRGFFKTDNFLEEVISVNAASIQNRHIRAYVLEIQSAMLRPYEISAESASLSKDGIDSVFIDENTGRIEFQSSDVKKKFEDILSCTSADVSPSKKLVKDISSNQTQSVNTRSSMKPHMTAPELQLFKAALENCSFLLEFGSGGSTVFAAGEGVSLIHSVDSDKNWLDKVASQSEIVNIDFIAHYIDIGPTKSWGHPINSASAIKWPSYYRDVWKSIPRTPDVVLVDGRFRVSCTLMAAIFCNANTKIIIHDFWDRQYYHIVLDFLDCVNRAGEIAEFRVKQAVSWKSLAETLPFYFLDAR